MQIGLKILKEKLDRKYYINCVHWCNNNSATIEDKGEYYEVVKIEENILTEEQKIKQEVKMLERQTGYTRIIRELVLATPVSEDAKLVANKIEKVAIKLRK